MKHKVWGSDEFAKLLDATVIGNERAIVMLRAYSDASHLPSGVFCVAAVGFGIERAKLAEKEWADLYGHRHGHMTDLHNGKKEFAGLEDDERHRIFRESVSIINRHASYIVAVACDMHEAVNFLPKTAAADDAAWLLNAYKGVYPLCMHWALSNFGDLIGKQRNGVSYWFESGDEYWGSANQFLSKMGSPEASPLRDSYQLASHAFLPASEARLFEAADLVAWEWATHVSRLRAGKPQRKSLSPLMDNHPCVVNGVPFCSTKNRYASFYTGWPVKKYMEGITQILSATSVDDMREVVARPWE
jgi:hypothetical protein